MRRICDNWDTREGHVALVCPICPAAPQLVWDNLGAEVWGQISTGAVGAQRLMSTLWAFVLRELQVLGFRV